MTVWLGGTGTLRNQVSLLLLALLPQALTTLDSSRHGHARFARQDPGCAGVGLECCRPAARARRG